MSRHAKAGTQNPVQTPLEPSPEILPQVIGLLVLGIYFVPGVPRAALWFAGIAGGLAIALLLYRLIGNPAPAAAAAASVASVGPAAAPPPDEALARPAALPLHELLHRIDWLPFEKLVTALYRSQGFSAQRFGLVTADGGVTLLLERHRTRTLVQCKPWKTQFVREKELRELIALLGRENISHGIFITFRGYTNSARELARRHGITLLERRDLLRLLEESKWRTHPHIPALLTNTAKYCPRCEKHLVQRTAREGWRAGRPYWGCSDFPDCSFTLDIPA